MRPRHDPALHPAVALGAGAALHALVLLVAAVQPAEMGPPHPTHGAAEIEVSLWAPAAKGHAASVTPATLDPARTVATAEHPRIPPAHASADGPSPPKGEPGASTAILSSPEGTDPPVTLVPRRKIDLGLSGSLGRALLLNERSKARATGPTSAGRLAEELDARDAARGLGRAGALVGAAQLVAGRDAPPFGSAVLEVRADASGRVATVAVVRFGSDGDHWQRVARALHARLAGHRLRVQKGARGVSCLLRIDRGALARDAEARDRTKRSAALGQGSLGPKDVREESTRSSMENGRTSPTLGTTVAGGGGGSPTRVVLLRERSL